jgi:TonB family protein
MTMTRRISPAFRRLAPLALGLALALAACGGGDRSDDTAGAEAPGVDIDVRPQLVNREEVIEAARVLYPADMQAAGLGGIVSVGIRVGVDGKAGETTIYETSGSPALDSAAVQVARRMEFSPGMLDGEPVPVWVQMPVTFRP